MTWKLKSLKTGKFVKPTKEYLEHNRSFDGYYDDCVRLMLWKVYPKGWCVDFRENPEDETDTFFWIAKLWTVNEDDLYDTKGNEKYEVHHEEVCDAVSKVYDLIGKDANKFGYEIVQVE